MRKWQAEDIKGKWTKRLINQPEKWMNRTHGNVTYEFCQFLTEHGHFGKFQHKIKKVPRPKCRYCENENDTPEHTIFECIKIENERNECEAIEGILTPANIIERILEKKSSWINIEKMAKRVINIKEKDERRRNGSASQK